MLTSLEGPKEAEFDSIYKELYGFVFSIAMRKLRSEHDANDVAQEILMRAWRQVQSGREILNLKAWASRAYTNFMISRARKSACRIKLVLNQSLMLTSDPKQKSRSNAGTSKEDLKKRLASAVSSLPLNQRDVVRRRIYEGESFIDIACDLEKTPAYVRKLFFLAKQSLTTKLQNIAEYC